MELKLCEMNRDAWWVENKSLVSNQSHKNGDTLFNEVALVLVYVYIYVYNTYISITQKTFQLFRKCLLIFDIWYESNSLIVPMSEASLHSP